MRGYRFYILCASHKPPRCREKGVPRGCVAEGVCVRVARGARLSFRRSRAAKWGCAEGARVQRKTVCRGADGKKVGARGAHVHLMTDVARARTSSACPPPPPGRKNLDVGVVRSGSHHSADSTLTRTHTRVCSACAQCMRPVPACSACVQCMRAVHGCRACVYCMRAVHACSAWVQCMHAVHGCSGCVQRMRAVHACSAWV